MTGEHEDRGGLAPQNQLQAAGHGNGWIQGIHGHHERCRSTGEVQGLGIVGNFQTAGDRDFPDSFLKAEGTGMILKIVFPDFKLPVAPAPQKFHRMGIIRTGFKPNRNTAVFFRRNFRGIKEHAPDIPILKSRVPGNRIKPG